MKEVLSGNEAIARGAYEAGVKVISSYPGTPSTEITENALKYKDIHVEWATNEKVACEVIIGASAAGVRSLTAMKHVGLNVAADPLMTFSYTGVNGGAVIIVADDPNMHSSQNEQDSRNYARFAKLPMLEPSDSEEALCFVKKAYDISEEYQTPVLIRSTTRLSHSLSVAELGERKEIARKPYTKQVDRWVMMPGFARKRHIAVEERLLKLKELSSEMVHTYMSESSEIGIITSGIAYQYVKEAVPEACILKIDMVWPLPEAKIKEFALKVDKLYVIEELDPIFETEIRAMGVELAYLNRSVLGELSVERVREMFYMKEREEDYELKLPVRPPNLCAGCPHRGIFYALNRLKVIVTGDIGCYTLGCLFPLNAMDTSVCMGASISMAHGFDMASDGELAKNSVAVIGDSTFLHTGINGIINSVYNGGHSTIIILDNRITGMTGHQPNAASGKNIFNEPVPAVNLAEICRSVGVKRVFNIDAFDLDECINVIKRELNSDEVSVIIADKPCIFADRTVVQPAYEVIEQNCTGCKMCLRIGCPAISWDEHKRHAVIDEQICVGCSLCQKVCRFSAIEQKVL